MGKYSLFSQDDRLDLESWNKQACCNNNCRSIDLISVLIAGYPSTFGESYTHCLSQKWSLGDCVAGCHNDLYDYHEHQNRNGHQTQLSREAVTTAIRKIEEADRRSESERSAIELTDFEALYEEVRKDIGNIDGIGDLTIYDTALRLGWNRHPQLLPKNFVYLHSGAMEGAEALRKVAILTHKNYFTYDGELGYRVEIDCFSKDLQQLGAMYLEDFLCVFHTILCYWAEGLERDKKNNTTKKQTK